MNNNEKIRANWDDPAWVQREIFDLVAQKETARAIYVVTKDKFFLEAVRKIEEILRHVLHLIDLK